MKRSNRRSGTLRAQQGSKKKRAIARMPFDVQTLLDVIPFYVMLIDEEHKILLTNKALRSDLGLDPREVIGGYCPKVVHGKDDPYPGCPLEESLERGGSVEREFFNSETGQWVSSAVYPTGKKTQEGRQIYVHFISDITVRKTAEEEVRKNYDIQKVINTILRLSLKDIPLEELLDRTLDLILSIRWLAIESKGCIFTAEEPGVLVMKSQRGLPRANQKRCARIAFDECLCGNAASKKEIVFSDRVDGSHQISYKGMASHGHYCVPILFAEKALGVINLYLKEGHRPNQTEKEFLTAIANALASVMARKRIDEALKQREKELEIKTGTLEEMNSALKVLLQRREEDRKELEEKVLFNVKELVVHYIEKLRNTVLDNKQAGYVDILESNLQSIVSPFSRTLSHAYMNLTPAEIGIADLVRQGKRTKEMADLLNVSTRTIEFHRKNIRKKLGIDQKKANLRTRLLSLQ